MAENTEMLHKIKKAFKDSVVEHCPGMEISEDTILSDDLGIDGFELWEILSETEKKITKSKSSAERYNEALKLKGVLYQKDMKEVFQGTWGISRQMASELVGEPFHMIVDLLEITIREKGIHKETPR